MRAFTENVSRTGMLMRWMPGVPLPALAGKLILDLELPENSEFGARVMRCRTEVVRIDPCDGDTYTVGLRVTGMRFIKSRQPMPARDLSSMVVVGDRVI